LFGKNCRTFSQGLYGEVDGKFKGSPGDPPKPPKPPKPNPKKMNSKNLLIALIVGLIVGAIYFAALVFCLGGASCGLTYTALKFPFLFAMPIAGFQIFGFASLNVLALLNVIFWIATGATLSYRLMKRGSAVGRIASGSDKTID
jgi:hypothetical protein